MNPTEYSDFDFLCNEPFLFPGIGSLKCPTLREIRRLSYRTFRIYLNLISISPEDYLKTCGLDEEYKQLSMYQLLLYGSPQLLTGLIQTFTADRPEYDGVSESFLLYGTAGDRNGHIGDDNFDSFRTAANLILGAETTGVTGPKFKNNAARKLYGKLKKGAEQKKQAVDENYSLNNMIRKYCTHNKVGINILNVWDMTYYQFIKMFAEYQIGRQYDCNDMMAANSFQFRKSSDYKPLDYMNK